MADTATSLREAGNAAVRSGDLDAAADAYTRALSLDPGDPALYHNRAVVRLRQRKYGDALADADAALSRKPDYSKAVSTRGAALQHLGRIEEAAAAFRLGLAFDPASTSLQDNLRAAEAMVAARAARVAAGGGGDGSSSGAHPPPAAPRASAAARPAPGVAAAPPPPPATAGGVVWPVGSLPRVVLAARLAVTAALLLYLLPVGSVSRSAWYFAMLAAAVAHVTDVLHRLGAPASLTDAAYVMRAASDASFHLIFLPLVWATAPAPSLLAAFAVATFDVLHVGHWLYGVTERRAPVVARSLAAAARLALPPLTRLPADAVARMTVGERWAAANTALLKLNAATEVWLAVFLVAGLPFARTRALVTLALHWHVLRFRFNSSQDTRDACGQLDATVGIVTGHAACPAAVRAAHVWLRGTLTGLLRVEPPPPGGPAAGAAGGLGGIAGALRSVAGRCVVT